MSPHLGFLISTLFNQSDSLSDLKKHFVFVNVKDFSISEDFFLHKCNVTWLYNRAFKL